MQTETVQRQAETRCGLQAQPPFFLSFSPLSLLFNQSRLGACHGLTVSGFLSGRIATLSRRASSTRLTTKSAVHVWVLKKRKNILLHTGGLPKKTESLATAGRGSACTPHTRVPTHSSHILTAVVLMRARVLLGEHLIGFSSKKLQGVQGVQLADLRLQSPMPPLFHVFM